MNFQNFERKLDLINLIVSGGCEDHQMEVHERSNQTIKAPDAVDSDDETVVNSPEKRARETEESQTGKQKKPKIRKLADSRMNAEELSEMKKRIAKSVTVVFPRT